MSPAGPLVVACVEDVVGCCVCDANGEEVGLPSVVSLLAAVVEVEVVEAAVEKRGRKMVLLDEEAKGALSCEPPPHKQRRSYDSALSCARVVLTMVHVAPSKSHGYASQRDSIDKGERECRERERERRRRRRRGRKREVERERGGEGGEEKECVGGSMCVYVYMCVCVWACPYLD